MIKQKATLFLFLLMFLSEDLQAQSFNLTELPISISYFGENAFHPGIKLGTFHTLWSATKTKQYRGTKRKPDYPGMTKLRELNLDLNLGGYSHPNNHTGYFVNTGLTFLHTHIRKGRQFGVGIELGYLRRDYKFKTYELDENGKIREIPAAGNNAVTIGLAPQFGKEFSIKGKPVRFFVKPIFQLVQYGHSWQPNTALELGTVINIHRKERL